MVGRGTSKAGSGRVILAQTISYKYGVFSYYQQPLFYTIYLEDNIYIHDFSSLYSCYVARVKTLALNCECFSLDFSVLGVEFYLFFFYLFSFKNQTGNIVG